MRAFISNNKKYKFNHPQDMQRIINYLEENGKINIDYQHLENLYYDYSDSVCCGWRIVDDISLAQFAEFLTHVEVTRGGYILVDDYYNEEDD